MSKIKYFQLAINENNHSMLFVSPNQKVINKAVNDGYTIFGFDNKADIPTTPILENGTVQEMTETEIATEIRAKKLARTIFPAQSIIEAIEAIDKENGNTDLNNKLLTTLSSNPAFSVYWGAYSNAINLEHPVCVQALTNFTVPETESLKLKIP